MNIGSCSLHKVRNAFRKGLSCLKIDLDQFSCDIYFFNSRREDYDSLKEVTEIASAHAMKHSSTRWLSLKKVCDQIIKLRDNLFQYF